jgi:enoyl-CoA hydratase
VSAGPVGFERRGAVALITLDRPEVHNAQNSAMLYALDEAFYRFVDDDELSVAVLRGAGRSFSSGHDIGTEGADYDARFERRTLWWDHVGKVGAENWLAREAEVYLGFCRRWRELPKPTIAMVHGACIAGGLMLAWSCDLIMASEDAFFADPVVRMGVPGVELFAHPWVMGPRRAKEFLFLGDRLEARRAYEVGMVNRVVPGDRLEAETMEVASRIAEMPRFGLATAKMAVNQAEDAMGYRAGTDAAFSLHQLAHLQAPVETGSPIRGVGVGPTRSALAADSGPSESAE